MEDPSQSECTESHRNPVRGWTWVIFQGHRDEEIYRPPKRPMHPFSSFLVPNRREDDNFEGERNVSMLTHREVYVSDEDEEDTFGYARLLCLFISK